MVSVIFEEDALYDVHHYLVGALQNLVNTKVSQVALDRVVLQVTIAAVHLQAVVDDVETLVCRKLLRHRAIHRVVLVT